MMNKILVKTVHGLWFINTLKILQADVEAKNEYGNTALIRAARRGNQAILTELLQAKAQPNASDNKGRTALHQAAENGSQAAVDLLIQAKADPTAVDKLFGETAAKRAEARGHAELAQRLIQAEGLA